MHAAPHRCVPAGQVEPHVPIEHEVVPPAVFGHTRPHIPQLLLSPWRLTQLAPQASGVAPPQRHIDPAHTCPAGHARPQAPQCIALLARSTHAPPQSVCAPQSAAHCPAAQSCPAAHVRPHAPQFKRSPRRSTHAPLQSVCDEAHAPVSTGSTASGSGAEPSGNGATTSLETDESASNSPRRPACGSAHAATHSIERELNRARAMSAHRYRTRPRVAHDQGAIAKSSVNEPESLADTPSTTAHTTVFAPTS